MYESEDKKQYLPTIEKLPVSKERLNSSTLEVLNTAAKEVASHSRSQIIPAVTSTELLIGIVEFASRDRDTGGTIWSILEEHGVSNPQDIYDAIRKLIGKETTSISPAYISWSGEVKKIMQHADGIREGDDTQQISPLHLLIALTSPQRVGIHTLALNSLEISQADIHREARKKLEEARSQRPQNANF